MEEHMLHLGDWRFSVATDRATLHALISNATDFKLFWMINVPCEEAEVEAEGETHYWRPKLYLESMTFPIRDWRNLEGQTYCTTADDDDPAAIYIQDAHQDMEESEICFTSRRGALFGIDWNFSWSAYTGMVQTEVRLTEITVWLEGVTDQSKAKRRLGQDLDLSLLSEPEIVSYPDCYPQFKFRPLADR
jgi:hypothetical protein